MKDLKREILNQVASGKISAEEGAAHLDSLESVESASPAGASRPAPPPFQAAPSGTRRVRVASAIGSAEIVGDPGVAYAVAEGPHRARQDGDTMVIEQAPLDENDHFSFSRADRRALKAFTGRSRARCLRAAAGSRISPLPWTSPSRRATSPRAGAWPEARRRFAARWATSPSIWTRDPASGSPLAPRWAKSRWTAAAVSRSSSVSRARK